VLARVPFRRRVAAACAEGGRAIDVDPAVAAAMRDLHRALREREAA
jgi:hypothetical protein